MILSSGCRVRRVSKLRIVVPIAADMDCAATAMPVQRYDLGALAIDEHVQPTAERIQAQFLLNQNTQTIDPLSEIDGHTARIHLGDLAARVHQREPSEVHTNAASRSGLGNTNMSRRRPPPRNNEQPL